MTRPVSTTYLEMTSPDQLRPSARTVPGFEVRQVEIPLSALNRWLYEIVGAEWQWFGKLEWSDEKWQRWVDRPELQTWIGYLHGTPAGYFELEYQSDDNVEIAYFGLLPQFFGRGLGGPFLTRAIQCAWAMGAIRIRVHTCTLDHPSALANYQARGLQIYNRG